MPRKNQPGCPCPTCAGPGPIPDDGSGCCSALPLIDLPGSLTIDTFSPGGGIIGSATVGPFVYHPGPFSFCVQGIGGHCHSNLGGYYQAEGVCVATMSGGCRDVSTLDGSPLCSYLYRNQRVTVTLACTFVTLPEGYHPDAVALAAIPRVRLFLTSNYGQQSTLAIPVDCANQCPAGAEGTGWYDCALTPPNVADPSNITWINKWRSVLSSAASRGVPDWGSPGLWAVNCDPANICYAVDARLENRAHVYGSIGLGACEVPEDPEAPGCVATVTIRRWCEGCPEPEEGGMQLSTVSAWAGGVRRGIGSLTWEFGAGGECLGSLISVRVGVPIDPGTAEPYPEYEVTLYLEPAHTPIETVVIRDCEPLYIEEGIPPEYVRVRWCLEGCPEGALPIASATVELLTEDESEVLYSTGIGEQGGACVWVALKLPDVGGDYKIRLSIQPVADGYAEKVVTFAQTLPDPGTQCLEIDLGTITAGPNEDYVCTCGGLVEKCLHWNGNGSEIELTYNAGLARWEGEELTSGQRSSGSGGRPCLGADPDPIPIAIVLTLDENCDWVATREFFACSTPIPCGTGPSRRVLSDDNGQERDTASDPVSVPTWGPLLPFGGVSLPVWSSTSDPGDPSHCLVPDEGYTPASVSPCTGGGVGGLMMAMAAPTSEPPLPSKLRMAGQLARTVGATVARAVKGQPTRTSAAEQERRWAICRACDHFRASDRRCGKIDGCGCWLDQAIPKAAKSCPLTPPKWGPEATGPASPAVSP